MGAPDEVSALCAYRPAFGRKAPTVRMVEKNVLAASSAQPSRFPLGLKGVHMNPTT